MDENLSEYLIDQEFLQFIKAMKVYYWTQDLYDLNILKKKCNENLKKKLKMNKVTNEILEEYYRFFEESISSDLKKKNPRNYLETVDSLVLLSQKHDKMIHDFGKDSIEANQILNEYLDYRLKLKIDIEENIANIKEEEIEEKINSYQQIIWSFFNKTKIIYLEHLNEVLIIWNDDEDKSIFLPSEKPTDININ
ncbi:MAG: hypothetical protein CML94_03815 [Rhodobiaceae bacterium]|nr:hypothetical protein [Rhodobiaceae bacterium]|tara:strand:- start:800 stop:1381 length:582 start_codon:yes stop_codon:yes gene_type:complete